MILSNNNKWIYSGNKVIDYEGSIPPGPIPPVPPEPTVYNVYTYTKGGGSITATPYTGVKGTEVSLSNTPDSNYQFNSYIIDGSSLIGNTFTIKVNDVSVTGVFDRIYDVNLTQSTGGTISANPMRGIKGTTVTLSNTPNTNYSFNNYTVNGHTISGNKLIIGNTDVNVSGSFKYDPQPVYVNRLNDRRSAGNNVYYYYHYMTKFSNQSKTPICGGAFNISSVTPNGVMPSSYRNMPQADMRSGAGNGNLSILLETSSLNEYTWGIWLKTATKVASTGIYFGTVGACSNNGNRYFTLADAYGAGNSKWGNTTVQKYNGSSGTEFGYGIDSGNSYYKFGIIPNTNTWYYFATYFNRTTHTVEYYINGNLYFKLTNVPDLVFTNSDYGYNAVYNQRNMGGHAYNSYGNTKYYCSFCEYVIYSGKRTDIPTSPITR